MDLLNKVWKLKRLVSLDLLLEVGDDGLYMYS